MNIYAHVCTHTCTHTMFSKNFLLIMKNFTCPKMVYYDISLLIHFYTYVLLATYIKAEEENDTFRNKNER